MEHQKLYGLSELNLNILQAEKVTLPSLWKASNVCSSFTRIYVITGGVGWIKYNDTTITMTPGNVYVIPAGVCFSYGCEDNFSKVYFHISLRQTDGYDVFQGFKHCFEYSDSSAMELAENNIECDTVIKLMRIKTYLHSLVCECLKQKEHLKLPQYSDYVTDIMEYIGKNLNASLSIEKIAKALFTSPEKLRKTFRSEVGISIGKYIDDRIMFTAELEVRCGNMSIKEISEYLGFCDRFYFSRCFFKKYGISPAKYRKQQI